MNVYFDDVVVNHKSGPVLEVTNYRAFGTEIATLSAKAFNKLENKYKYNGKELQSELDLSWYDYGARMYDDDLGRLHVVDPMADKFSPSSPYCYAVNNPVLLNDPNGKDWTIDITIGNDGRFNIYFTVNAAVVNESGKKIDMVNYIKTQSEIFSKIFSLEGKGFTVSGTLNMREVKSQWEVKNSEHFVVIGSSDNFESGVGGHSNLGGLRIDINGANINADGTTKYNGDLHHEFGHTGGLDHPFEPGDEVQLYQGRFLGLFAIPRTVSAHDQKKDVDLQTNFMSYPLFFINNTPEGQRKLNEVNKNPGKATRGQVQAILIYYLSGYLNNDDKDE
jgi:RHS repeat-associated protein